MFLRTIHKASHPRSLLQGVCKTRVTFTRVRKRKETSFEWLKPHHPRIGERQYARRSARHVISKLVPKGRGEVGGWGRNIFARDPKGLPARKSNVRDNISILTGDFTGADYSLRFFLPFLRCTPSPDGIERTAGCYRRTFPLLLRNEQPSTTTLSILSLS